MLGTLFCGRPRRRSRRNAAAKGRSAATVEIGRKTTTLGVVALGAAAKVGVVAATMGVAAPTTAVEVAAVTEAAATRLGLGQVVVEPDAVRAVVLGETTGEVVAVALGGDTADEERRERPLPRIQHFKLFQLVYGFQHRPRRGHGSGGSEASDSFLGGC